MSGESEVGDVERPGTERLTANEGRQVPAQTEASSLAEPRRRTQRRVLIVGAVAVAAALIAAAMLLVRQADLPAAGVKVSGTAALFELENVRPGEAPVSLEAFRGTPVVLNFWASWCFPCRREMPAFAAVSETLQGRVAFVGVNHQDQRAAALDLLAETGVSYPSGFDPRGSVAADYGLFGMPTTVFISAEGEVLERRTGEMPRKELEETIARLFGA